MPSTDAPKQRQTNPRALARRALEVFSDIYLRPIASILMLRSPVFGLGLWAVLMVQPLLGGVAFVAATISEGFGWAMNRLIDDQYGLPERVNNLLVGLIVAWLLLPLDTPVIVILSVLLATLLLTTVITTVLRRVFDRRGLPILITPYAVVAVGLFTLMPLAVHNAAVVTEWPPLNSASYSEIPLNFLPAMGVIVLSPWEYAGIAVLFMVMINAPVVLFAGLLGWLGGLALAQGLLLLGVYFVWEVTSYNFFLAGIGAGTAFFVPSRGTLILAPFAGALAALIAALLQNFLAIPGLSILPIPFVATSFFLITAFERGLLHTGMDWLATPADKWLRFTWMRRRWGETMNPLFALPVSCPVRVTQGFNSEISHRGAWRHAFDFEGLEPSTSTVPGIWGETVYPPMPGAVVDIRDDIPDNPLRIANHDENWGNFALIRSDMNFHFLLAHLMPGSLSVSPGQRVGFSTRIGRVGNSGRSYIPHLHMQAQREGYIGAPTIPFRIANYLELDPDRATPGHWRAADLPLEGAMITAARSTPAVHALLASLLSGQTIWSVKVSGHVPPWIRLRQPVVSTTALTPSGSYLVSCFSDYLEAALDIDGWRVIDVRAEPGSLISTLARAMATIPYCAVPELEWSDVLPLPLSRGRDTLLRNIMPFSERRLETLALRCTSIPSDHDVALKLTAEVQSAGSSPPVLCRVALVEKRGPVSAELSGQGFSVNFLAMAFEAAPA